MSDLNKIYSKIKSGDYIASKVTTKKLYESMLGEAPPGYPPNNDLENIPSLQSNPPAQPVPEPAAASPQPVVKPVPQVGSNKTGNTYVDYILSKFGNPETIERLYSVTGIQVPESSTAIAIDKKDIDVWNLLYNVKPPKEKEKEVQTAGAGNGELSLFWFLYMTYGDGVQDNRGGRIIKPAGHTSGAPDLAVNGKGVEIKSYGKDIIKLGKFGAAGGKETGYVNNVLLNYLFGFNALFGGLSHEDKTTLHEVAYVLRTFKEKSSASTLATSNPGNFTAEALTQAFEKTAPVAKIFAGQEFRDIINVFNYTIFNDVARKIDYITTHLNVQPNEWDKPEELAKRMLTRVVKTKLDDKPGEGGYIVDVSVDGHMAWSKYTSAELQKNFELNDAYVANTELHFNISKVLGPISRATVSRQVKQKERETKRIEADAIKAAKADQKRKKEEDKAARNKQMIANPFA